MKKQYSKLRLLVFILCLGMGFQAFAQKTVSGTVSDETGGLPGVNIIIKGTTQGTTTDIDGKYSLQVTSDETILVFKYIGFQEQEITVGNRSVIDVSLAVESTTLEELVVVGYGTQKKRDVTGSISKVSAEELVSVPTSSFEQALQGKAAGLQVIQGSGMAGSGSIVRIRGIASVSAGGDPLYVVDGVPISNEPVRDGNGNLSRVGFMNTNPLATLNPNDIESVEILKDAGSAAIYGARGANGVILITTKKGKKDKLSVNFSARYGVSAPSVKMDLLNSRDWLTLRQEAWENDGGTGYSWLPGYSSISDSEEVRAQAFSDASKVDTDWWEEVTRTGFKQDYSLGIQKGGEKFNHYVGIAYSEMDSYIRESAFSRLSGRYNVDWKPVKGMNVSLRTSLSRANTDVVQAPWEGFNGWSGGGLGSAMSEALPIYPVFNPDGTYFTAGANPLYNNFVKDIRSGEVRTINNLSVSYEVVDNLILNVSAGYDLSRVNNGYFEKAEINNVEGIGSKNTSKTENWNALATANYSLSVNENSRFSFLAGAEVQKSQTYGKSFNANQVSNPLWESPNEIQVTNTTPFRLNDEWSFAGYFGRVNFTHKDRYIAQVTARADASSRFGANNRTGFFPSASLAWIASEEDFMKNSNVVSFFKLKASYGVTGNANIGSYTRFGTMTTAPPENFGYGGFGNTAQLIQNANPDLKWEILNNFDAGFELYFFKDRVQTEFSYYNKVTSDVLLEIGERGGSTGFGSSGLRSTFFTNAGEIKNTGFDFSVTSKNLVGNFKWSTSLNLGYNTNEVVSTGGYTSELIRGGTNDTRIVAGQPLGANYLVRFSRVDPTDGLPIWLDANGVETKTWSNDHRVVAGGILPDMIGGITNNFEYKGFDLTVQFNFVLGGKLYENSGKRQLGVISNWTIRGELADRWQQPGDVAQFPKLTLTPSNYPGLPEEWQYNSTLFLYDASFVRLRNLALGYTFKQTAFGGKLSNCRVFVSGTNLLLFTKYPGDPEIARDFDNTADRNTSANVTFLTAPQERSVNFGVNVSF